MSVGAANVWLAGAAAVPSPESVIVEPPSRVPAVNSNGRR